MPPETQPVRVVSWHFKQQQSSKHRQVVRSGQVSGQLSHQQKHGCNLQQQCKKCGSFSWQQPLQSQQVSQPHPLLHDEQPLLHELLQLGAALQLASHEGAAALLQLLLLSEAEACAGAVGAAGAAVAAGCEAL